jgi:hypothetical protein
MRVFAFLLAVQTLAATAAAQSPADSLLPTDSAVTIGRLPNGLRYYVRVNRRRQRAELGWS